jgi:predicted ester cyclase
MAGLSRETMDRMIDEHFSYESKDDVEGVMATLAPAVDHEVVGGPWGAQSDHGDIRQLYSSMFADLGGGKVTTLRRNYGEDFVVDESLWEGVAVGTPFGLPGNGRPLSFRLLHVFEFTGEGRIRRENVWLDLAAIQRQLA